MAGERYLFRNFNQALARGPARPEGALKWFRETARQIGAATRATPNKVLEAQDIMTLNGVTRDVIGHMLCFFYDPKLKAELPYYDRFPMIFLVDVGPNYFHGINLHYLPPMARAKLMDALYSLRTNPRTLDAKTKLNVSYQILKGSTRLPMFKPCFKKYLVGHVRSQFKRVNPPDWDKILLMPIARFAKASEETVWSESLKSGEASGRRRRTSSK